MYVYCAIGGTIGVSAAGEDKGKLRGKQPEWNTNVIAPSPLCMPDGKIFMTAGYGAGSIVLQLNESNDNISYTVVDKYKPSEGLACEQQTPILWNGFLLA